LVRAIVLRPFESEVTHLLLHDAWVATEPTSWESDSGDVVQQALIELVEVLGSSQLKVADSVLDDLKSMNKTQTIRIKVGGSSLLVHEKA